MSETKNRERLELQDRLKQKAASYAVDFVQSGMVLGLGTGSTTRFALENIGLRIKNGQLQDIVGIPSSLQTEKIAKDVGIPLTSFDEHQEIDLTIDGADEVDPQLNLIKGGGGALLREKILAQSSRRNIIIVDENKLSPRLGTHFSLPLEVIPFAWKPEANYVSSLGADVTLRKSNEGNPYTTDQNNFILDCKFGPISDLNRLASKLSQRAGIVEHGLFLGLATEVIVATENGIRHLKRKGI
ncbi:MAG: ribose 5-phosphate isomerase A [Candidatus Dadabacteria bacterium]|nr:ribose 5-phosphate isomerase A [Candidatus Dadabacteria bacterium]